ncbi:uncharacterized protein LOC62_04G006271 [Vanrija pseudolonga]|uniref:Uncharacterized protein n=1 Tax=Vanrija pseudolonga TaxID=143232 RepID=A0AAF1BRZ0_9TREE|nr:hypothetical protein LOC62_04G006271 [Vanrija pseudolonga]
MLFKVTIPFLLLITSALAAPTPDQADTIEARDPDAGAPAVMDEKRWWPGGCLDGSCPIPCGVTPTDW